MAWLLQLAADCGPGTIPRDVNGRGTGAAEQEMAARLSDWLPKLRYPIREGARPDGIRIRLTWIGPAHRQHR
jgi:hypothetical protein